ncbi:MAG: fibrobacter succinogenes major paralogous domain-containing protein [Chitinispirillales bacterium]|jgi:uncharacterized protein (TIGR02145 family)|nr:fibrobacter succinogenes major paralogous domain-containing protein [Chitinispirillales bacterium]
MFISNHTPRALLLAVALLAVVWSAWLAGCGNKDKSFTDERDGQRYRTVKIVEQTWMAENLNYTPSNGNSWCYENSADSCNKYGRLYDWSTARVVCPSGWHLPSSEEWDNLSLAVGGKMDCYKGDNIGFCYWDGAGKKLKAKGGWNAHQGKSGNSTNAYGFSALPGGSRHSTGRFDDAGSSGIWWTATEYHSDYAYGRDMFYDLDHVSEHWGDKDSGLSVRCVGD